MLSKKIVSEYLLDEWIIEIQKEIKLRLEKKSWIIVVLIAWWTASWKTSAVATKIKETFADSQILSMDNYYRGPSFMKENPKYNFDQPEVLNLELFFKHLKDLKKGKDVMIPFFDFKNEPKLDFTLVKSSKIIIIEWLFALTNKIAKLWDIKIFVELWTHSQILRRLFRDVERTRNKPSDILKYFLWVISPMHKKYIEPTKKNAWFILLNDYIPNLESKNAKIKDTKLKFIVNQKDIKNVLSEIIYKLWWTYLWKTLQTDYFFSPNNWKYKKTWEIMKIRKIDFWRYFFTYFWPIDKEKSYEDRYTMQFFIDYDTLKAFKELYPENIIEISKLRRTFFVSWVLVCLDELETGETYLLFKFDEKNKRTIILDVLEHLDVDARKGIKKSYLELIN